MNKTRVNIEYVVMFLGILLIVITEAGSTIKLLTLVAISIMLLINVLRKYVLSKYAIT